MCSAPQYDAVHSAGHRAGQPVTNLLAAEAGLGQASRLHGRVQQLFHYHKATEDNARFNQQISRALWGKFKATFEAAADKNFYVALCTYSYAATTLKIGGTNPSGVVYGALDASSAITPSVRRLCARKLARYREWMGGITYDGWGLEIEVNYYPFRANHGHFDLHKDDYFRSGVHQSREGGVMFVCLVYLVDYPVFGPEVMLDRGSGFDFAELTRVQLDSLPPTFCERVTVSKMRWIDSMKLEQMVFCPIIEPWSEVIFCDTLAIHQTPATLDEIPADLKFRSHNPNVATATPEDREFYNDEGVEFPLNTKSARQNTLPLVRQLDEYYSRRSSSPAVQETFDNTNHLKRSFLRLTFRAKRP